MKSPRAMGPSSLQGSSTAKQQAVVLLEVLSGAKGPQEGCESLGISLNRYYQLETRGLQGLIHALEPKPRGKQLTPERKLALAERENARLAREVSRYQALLRAAQRSLGVKSSPKRKISGKSTGIKKKRRTRTVRATKAIAALRSTESPPAGSAS